MVTQWLFENYGVVFVEQDIIDNMQGVWHQIVVVSLPESYLFTTAARFFSYLPNLEDQ